MWQKKGTCVGWKNTRNNTVKEWTSSDGKRGKIGTEGIDVHGPLLG